MKKWNWTLQNVQCLKRPSYQNILLFCKLYSCVRDTCLWGLISTRALTTPDDTFKMPLSDFWEDFFFHQGSATSSLIFVLSFILAAGKKLFFQKREEQWRTKFKSASPVIIALLFCHIGLSNLLRLSCWPWNGGFVWAESRLSHDESWKLRLCLTIVDKKSQSVIFEPISPTWIVVAKGSLPYDLWSLHFLDNFPRSLAPHSY